MNKNNIIIKIIALSVVFLFSLNVWATHTPQTQKEEKIEEEITGEHQNKNEKFQPGEFILGHVGDAYEWHILDFEHTHVSIPLPIILYSEHSGLNLFMSSRFHHGTESYKGFSLAEEGEYKGKIIETYNGEISVPLNLSISKNVVALFVSLILLLWIFISVANRYKANPNSAPKGLQSVLEPFILFVRDDIAKDSIGEKRYLAYTPFLLTIFFFIFINNLLGLVPIFPFGANLTGNIAVTMVLALFTFAITTFSGNKHYWKHIFNAPGIPWWLKFPIPLMPIVELMGVFTKPFVLMVRLFANITAGHIIALGFYSLIFIFGEMHTGLGYGVSVVSVTFVIFMTFLELLVALIQAYVFTLLSALYFGMAVEEAH